MNESLLLQLNHRDLPITEHLTALQDAIANHPVVIVCGETGSGKTTQLPQLCLAMGLAEQGLIGHTQPRRLAARAVANRLAEELNSNLGELVGYQVRFTQRVGQATRIKLMTDGILLAETRRDPRLKRYSVLIIDEAHERSLTIDFLLGYVQRLLKKRHDLKVIITSATIDTQQFARHFNQAPIIEVAGRGYPVTIRYRPLQDHQQEAQSLLQGVLAGIDECWQQGPGDILVFLSGEREIHEVERYIKRRRQSVELLPLYSRLPTAQQQRIFQSHGGKRVILTTNVAETSLTVPGIRFVIDGGTARISRYSPRSKVQRLPIEAISQASANQRAGRCGRIGPGLCIRLYSEEDYKSRSPFTPPEILRTNLASVILRMHDLRLGAVVDFPFIDAPEQRLINDGYQLLAELQGVDEQQKLTKLGHQLAQWPVDPRLARMIIAGHQNQCLYPVLVLVAVMSAQDPRERPPEKRAEADACHQQWQESRSDFLTLWRLWQGWQQVRQHQTRSGLRRWCRQNYLSATRLYEWQALVDELTTRSKQQQWHYNPEQAPDYHAFHQALLTGLLTHSGMPDPDQPGWIGVRNRRFHPFGDSVLAKKQTSWVMAAELIEIQRIYGRLLARIEPKWLTSLAHHLLKWHVHDPQWSVSAGRVKAYQSATLYGLPIVERQSVDYALSQPKHARQLFIEQGLVANQTRDNYKFLHHNQQQVAEIIDWEQRVRRRDLLVDESIRAEWYQQKLPHFVVDEPSLKRWLGNQGHGQLQWQQKDLLAKPLPDAKQQFPDTLVMNQQQWSLSYQLEPGSLQDGVTLTIPVALLDQVDPVQITWLVPGLLLEKIIALLRGLPKTWRRRFVPVTDYAQALLERLQWQGQSLPQAMGDGLRQMTGVTVPTDAWSTVIDDYLVMRLQVVDSKGKILYQGRDLAQARGQCQQQAQQQFSRQTQQVFTPRLVERWDFADLDQPISQQQWQAWPALVVKEQSLWLELVATRQQAQQHMRQALPLLIAKTLGKDWQRRQQRLPHLQGMARDFMPTISLLDLQRDLAQGILLHSFCYPWSDDWSAMASAEQFAQCLDLGQQRLSDTIAALSEQTYRIAQQYHQLRQQRRGLSKRTASGLITDVDQQLAYLIYPGFIENTPMPWWRHLPRYLQAITQRMAKYPQQPLRDQQQQQSLVPVWAIAQQWLSQHETLTPLQQRYRWGIEEWRVSLFAQPLGTDGPISAKRLAKLHQQIAQSSSKAL